jgi:hypothetical protein
MFERRDSRQKITLQDRLSAWANEVRKRAARLPPSPARDDMLKKASQASLETRLAKLNWMLRQLRREGSHQAAPSTIAHRGGYTRTTSQHVRRFGPRFPLGA